MNYSDGERLATVLKNIGYQETKNEDEADLIAIVACSVKQAAVDRIHSKIHHWQLSKETRPLITILSGCVLEADRKKLAHKFDLFIDIKNLDNLANDIASIHPAEGPERERGKEKLALPSFFDISPSYGSTYRAYVPIMTGCNKFCSYCAVPYTRGRETSRPSENILSEIKNLLDKGYKEIVLLGQNVNSYGLDKKGQEISFPELLKKIDSLSKHFWLKFLTSHPYDMSDELIEVMSKCKNLNDYLHLPVQCGSDEILKKMNRHYTVAQYKKLIKKIRKLMPHLTISTDIIVGFCGETEDDFSKTKKLVKNINYNLMYISQYSSRAGTIANKMYKDDVPKTVKKKRWQEMNAQLTIQSFNFNKNLIGQKYEALIDLVNKEEAKFVNIGKLSNYLPVHIENTQALKIGNFYQVEISEALDWGVKAKLI